MRVYLIEDIKKSKKIKLGKAVYYALKQVVGAYAIVAFDSTNPKELVGARLGSPLAIGVGESEYYFDFLMSSIRLTSTSESVSELNVYPFFKRIFFIES